MKKHRWCAWDSNMVPQDGSWRRNHGAMVAAIDLVFLFVRIPQSHLNIHYKSQGANVASATRKKSPNFYRKLPKNDFTRKMKDFTPLQ